MFSDKQIIGRLTALLQAYEVQEVVACPGSRNAPIVHNLHEAGFRLTSVTDERSAGFVALGIALALQRPVAVCVTSGSALLALLPAVAEAYYRCLPLLVISADRPASRLGQWEGQTLPQVDALQPYAPCFNVADDEAADSASHHTRLLNEALTRLTQQRLPVHVNVQINEPLFRFTTEQLPAVRRIRTLPVRVQPEGIAEYLRPIAEAHLPLLVVGQMDEELPAAIHSIRTNGQLLVLPEIISAAGDSRGTNVLEMLLEQKGQWPLAQQPDVVIHMGGHSVGKQLRLFLRRQKKLQVVRIEHTEAYADTFDHLTAILRMSPAEALPLLAQFLPPNDAVRAAAQQLQQYVGRMEEYVPQYMSDLGVMRRVAAELADHPWIVHLANSSAIRNAACYLRPSAQHRIFANRGTNGIEGSLSTAIGHALRTDQPVLLLIGDLSFFYDLSALALPSLPRRLRIVLFNNGGGQIFSRLPGLEQSPALPAYISAQSHHTASGIATAFGLRYAQAHTMQDLQSVLHTSLYPAADGPTLLEVFTETNDNQQELDALKRWVVDGRSEEQH